ncbi:amidophosphoribosyltransferase [Amycolatopsis stemonae]
MSEVVRVPTAGLVRVFSLARYRGVARRLLIAYKERGRRDLAPSLGWALAEALAVLPLRAQVAASAAGVAPAVAAASAARVAPAASVVSAAPVARTTPDVPAPAGRPSGSSGSRSWRAETGTGTVPALCLVPAPSRRPASRTRGGPHVERLAKSAAKTLAARGFEVTVAPALELAGGVRDAVGLDRAQRAANLAGRLRFREAGRPPPGSTVVVLDDVITTGATAAACVRALAAEGITVAAVLTLLSAG